MPISIMMEDAAGYDEQMRQIQKWHNRKRDLKGAEFLGRFFGSDKIRPIVTLVLYYGTEPWSGAKDLHQMMDFQSLPEEGSGINMCRAIRELIEDGRIEGRAEGKAEGKAEDLLEGTQRINELNRRLLADGRQEDMIKAVQDFEYQELLLMEYGL